MADKIYVADSYKNAEILGPVVKNEKGKPYVTVRMKCDRCDGRGFWAVGSHNGQLIPTSVDHGTCYKCGGGGYIMKDVRAYTEEEYNANQRVKERARKRREEAAAAREAERLENAAIYKHNAALKLGFGENEKAYLVYGDDTFAIKDQLKEMGARFDPILKWYFPNSVELPSGYKLYELAFDDVYEYNPSIKWATYKENAKQIVSKRMAELNGPSTSIYYPAKEKERIYNITAKLHKIGGFEGSYGYTFVYTFTSGDYVFVWMTTKQLEVEPGDLVDLTGTVKKFDEYLGVRQTHLNRCKVIVIKEKEANI